MRPLDLCRSVWAAVGLNPSLQSIEHGRQVVHQRMPDQAVIQSFLVPVRGDVSKLFVVRPGDVVIYLCQRVVRNTLKRLAEQSISRFIWCNH